MNLHWVEEIKPVLEMQEFLDGLIECGRVEQGIEHTEWWKQEECENLDSNFAW
jgi:hypothetical protein